MLVYLIDGSNSIATLWSFAYYVTQRLEGGCFGFCDCLTSRGRGGVLGVLRHTFKFQETTSKPPKTIFLFLKIQKYQTSKPGLDRG